MTNPSTDTGAAPVLRLVPDAPRAPILQRAHGICRVGFKRRDRFTVLDDLYQSGCAKIRLPNMFGGDPEAVLINTSGGLTDGDILSTHAEWKTGATAVVTTQACERVYRSRSAPARVNNSLRVADGATAFWLPQETILFDGGRIRREATASLSGTAKLVACESFIMGRPAMGEQVQSGSIFDAWKIKRDGRLVFADRLGLEGDLSAQLDRRGCGDGARAFATVIYAGDDSARVRDLVRPLIETGRAGCSDLGGIMLARLLATSGHELRAMLRPVLTALRGAEGLPRVWMS